MSEVKWNKDVDAAMAEARTKKLPLLLDFNAAPMWGACARLDAEVYPDAKVSEFIRKNFIPVKIHIKEQPATFKRFGVQWTPTLEILDPDGTERYRFEGYLPPDDFLAQLELGLAKSEFARERWGDAEKRYREIVRRFPESEAAAESLYWAGVAKYKATGNASALKETAELFKKSYTGSAWAKKASVWSG